MSRLKILWLSHFVPFPPTGGVFQRGFNLIRRVASRHDVYLLALKHKQMVHPDDDLRRAQTELLKYCREVDIVDISGELSGLPLTLRAIRGALHLYPLTAAIYRSQEMRRLLRQRLQELAFDVAHFDTIGLATYLRMVRQLPTVVTHLGPESYMIRRRMKYEPAISRRAAFSLEWLLLRRFERRMCPLFDVNVCVSAFDKELMAGVAPALYTIVENGVDVDYYEATQVGSDRTLIFAGRLDQYANRDGILHFMSATWPLLKSRYPDVLITVVGNNPPEALLGLAARDPSIRVTGFVPDVRPFFKRATVYVCPVRDGGGTRLKILDAMAQGMPLVSTSIACEGIEVQHGSDILIADTPAEFVGQIGRVFEDGSLRSRLARNARKTAESKYSWDGLSDKLVSAYRLAKEVHSRESPKTPRH